MKSPAPAAETEAGAYEKLREATIKANMDKMRSLGLLHLSRDAHAAFAPKPNPNPKRLRRPTSTSTSTSTSPPRRSSRLQTVEPFNYTESKLPEPRSRGKSDAILIKQGDAQEFYTEDHHKLLGSCKVPWTLFATTRDKDDKRTYDQLQGKSCHQCRQKTMGYRTNCCKCCLARGQFCGDCLYTRYGENILEAIENPDWMCPPCRDICNCSNCRIKKGWIPTGNLYRKVVNLGYESVAHYLIRTRQKPPSSEQASSFDIEVVMSDGTEAAKENKQKSGTIAEESDEGSAMNGGNRGKCCVERERKRQGHSGYIFPSVIVATSDKEISGKRRRVKREEHSVNTSPGPIAARLRRRHYGI